MSRYLLYTFLVAIFALVAIIVYDLKSDNQNEVEGDTELFPDEVAADKMREPEVYSDFHGEVDFSDTESIYQRMHEIEHILEKQGHTRESVPFYGELMMLYLELGREDAAAEASRHIAMVMHDSDDWWNAAVLFYRWALKQQNTDTFEHYLYRSDESFRQAIEIGPNAELITDHAILLQALGRSDEALSQLELARIHDESYSMAFLYTGLILHEQGKKNESISYISKSLELAADVNEREQIRRILAESSIEI